MWAVNIHEAKTHLSKLILSALEGEEVLIAKAGIPLVKLIPVGTDHQKRLGAFKGKIFIAEDFDAPLPDNMINTFYGDSFIPQEGDKLS
jgi:prevent-host-death family protein